MTVKDFKIHLDLKIEKIMNQSKVVGVILFGLIKMK